MTRGEKLKALVAYIFAPFASSRYWFATAYTLLILFAPILNQVLLKLNKKGFLLLLAIMYMPFVLLGTFFLYPFLGFTKALFYYAVGAYLQLHCSEMTFEKPVARIADLIMAICAMICFALLKYSAEKIFAGNPSFVIKLFAEVFYPLTYGLLAPICAIGFFRFFGGMTFKNKVVNLIASTTFGCYLMQEGVFNRNMIFGGILKISQTQYLQALYPLYAVVTVIVIFIVFSSIDLIRQIVFEPLYLKAFDRIADSVNENLFTK